MNFAPGGAPALIRAARNGQAETVDVLLGHGARVDAKVRVCSLRHCGASDSPVACSLRAQDGNGLTAADWARRNGHERVARRLAAAAFGDVGELMGADARGVAWCLCPWGCPAQVPAEEEAVVRHARTECELRLVRRALRALSLRRSHAKACPASLHVTVCVFQLNCPNGCDATDIVAAELPGHVVHCSHRPVDCPLRCGHPHVPWSGVEEHVRTQCSMRVITCPLGCEASMLAGELPAHETTCAFRLLPCPQRCGATVPYCRLYRHTSQQCPQRAALCPLRCGARMHAGEVPAHVADACPCRLAPCPRGCGAHVHVRQSRVRMSDADRRRLAAKLLQRAWRWYVVKATKRRRQRARSGISQRLAAQRRAIGVRVSAAQLLVLLLALCEEQRRLRLRLHVHQFCPMLGGS